MPGQIDIDTMDARPPVSADSPPRPGATGATAADAADATTAATATDAVPDLATMRAALERAVRAPSIHNSQPWRWQRRGTRLELFADHSRWLAATDPDKVDLYLSCGAALHHARVAFAALGWSTVVHRVPAPRRPGHLATVEFRRTAPIADTVALSDAILKRRTDRAPYSSWEVPDGLVRLLERAGSEQGAVVVAIGDGTVRGHLGRALAQAEAARGLDRDYSAELAEWTGSRGTAGGGVPDASFRAPTHPLNRHPFHEESGWGQADSGEDDASIFLIVGTVHDGVEACLRAGEAASAILLEATEIGLATCPLSLPVEVAGTREYLRHEVFGDVAVPRLIIRVGWAHTRSSVPNPTPRFPLDAAFEAEPLGEP